MMGTRQKLDGDGVDVVTGWRRWLCCLKRPGVASKTKRRLRKRRRREPIKVNEADWRAVGGDFAVVGEDLRRAMAAYRDSFSIMERGD